MNIIESQSIIDAIAALFKKPEAIPGKTQNTPVSSLSLTGSAFVVPKANNLPKAPTPKAPTISLKNVMNYTDPLEMNSFADALFNVQAMKNRHWFGNPKQPVIFAATPWVRPIAGIIDVFYTGSIKPLISDSNQDNKADWDWAAAGLNGLNNLSETLDIVANPVKGAIIEGFNMNGSTEGLTAGQGFSRGLGVTSIGRKQYDYNVETGKGKLADIALNLVLEVFSDPLNYVSFGASTAGKMAGKAAAKKILTEATEAAGKNLGIRILKLASENMDDALDLVRSTYGDEMAETFLKAAKGGAGSLDDFAVTLQEQTVKSFTSSPQFKQITRQVAKEAMYKNADIPEALQKAIQKTTDSNFDKGLWDTLGKTATEKNILLGELQSAIPAALLTTPATQARTIVRAMNGLYNASEETQKVLLKSVLYSNPFGLGLVGGKYAVTKLWAKYGSTRFIARQLAKQFSAGDMRNTEKILQANEYLQRLGKTADGVAADVSDETIMTTIQMGTESELADVLALRAKFKDPAVAREQIAKYIRGKYNKTISEYMEMLIQAPRQASLTPQSKALFAQHAAQLYYVLSDVTNPWDYKLNITPLIKNDATVQLDSFIQKVKSDKDIYDGLLNNSLVLSVDPADPLRTDLKFLKDNPDFIGYVAKISQLDAAYRLMSIPEVEDLVRHLGTPEGMFELNKVLTARDTVGTATDVIMGRFVENLKLFTDSYKLEHEIMQRVLNNAYFNTEGIEHNAIVVAYLDALYTHANTDFNYIQKNAGEVLNDILKRMEGKLNGASIKAGRTIRFVNEPVLKDAIAAEFRLMLSQRSLQISINNISQAKLFNQMDANFADGLNRLGKYYSDAGSPLGAKLQEAAISIKEELILIKESNALGQSIILPKATIDELGPILGVPGAVNASQLLSNAVEYLPGIGPEIRIHVPFMRTYFNEAYWMANVYEATAFAKHLNNTMELLKDDVDVLLRGKEDEVKALFEHLQASLPVENSERNKALKALIYPSDFRSAIASTLELMREVRARTDSVGGATIPQTLHLTLDRVASPDLVEVFIKRYPLLDKALDNNVKAGIDITRQLTISAEHINAELTLNAFKDRRSFFGMQEDMLEQWYRFDQKYKLVFADRTITQGKALWDSITKAATEDQTGTAEKLYSYMDSVCRNAADYVLSLRGDDLVAHVIYNARGLVVINFQDWANSQEFAGAITRFIKENKDAELLIDIRDNKLIIGTLESTPRIGPTLLKTPPAEAFIIEAGLPEDVLNELRNTRGMILEIKDGMRRMLKVKAAQEGGTAAQRLAHESFNTLYATQSVGSLISSEAHTALLESLPQDLQDMIALPVLTKDMFDFDYSNLASPRLRKLTNPYASSSIVHTYSNVLETYLGYAESTLKARMMLTSDSSLNRFSNLFENISDEEALRILQADRTYRVVYAQAADTPFGYRIKELRPYNTADIRLLRESDAIVVDHNTHRMLRNMLNRGEIKNGFVKIFNNVIISPTKAAMLSSAGFIVRNFLDSNMKNYAGLDSPSEIAAFTRHSFEATRWLHLYESDMKQILKIADSHIQTIRILRDVEDLELYGPDKASLDAFFLGYDRVAEFLKLPVGEFLEYSPEELNGVFARLTPEQLETIARISAERSRRRDIFNLIHSYIAQGPSAGYVKAQQDVLDKAFSKEVSKMTWDEKIKHAAWTNRYTRYMMNVQSYIEQTARFSKFTWDIMHDKTVAEAMHNVILTHFDYSTKSSAMLYLEVFMPFTTFAIANAEFWVDQMSRHGWIFGALRDLYSATMTPSEYSQYEMQNNRALQYALLNGTLMLDDNGFGLKLNPSMMDVYNLITNPIAAVQQRIANAVKIPMDIFLRTIRGELKADAKLAKDILTIVPVLGIFVQRYWPASQEDPTLTGSAIKAWQNADTLGEKLAVVILPSLFSEVGRAYYFNYPSKNEVWKTYDPDVYMKQLEQGAVPVITTNQAKQIESRMRHVFYYGEKQYFTYDTAVYEKHIANGATDKPVAPMIFYYGDKQYKTYNAKRYAYHLANGATQKPGQKKTYASFHTSTGYSRRSAEKYSSGLIIRNQGLQIRPFGEALNLSFLAPAIWRRVYTAGGNDRFKVRLTKPTAKNLQYRIRMSWRYWR